MNHPSKCPACDVSWCSELSIPEELMLCDPEYYNTVEKAREVASDYGWTVENNKSFGTNVTGIEDPSIYDGIIGWECEQCGHRLSPLKEDMN